MKPTRRPTAADMEDFSRAARMASRILARLANADSLATPVFTDKMTDAEIVSACRVMLACASHGGDVLAARAASRLLDPQCGSDPRMN